ncbi:MAG TPA: serine/threonine-protein kinase [Kofleriaceae bacterium]|nr:serine/threonine-protein kinase [Kofleriaceae bacterium]
MVCPDERVMLDLVAGRIPAQAIALRDHLDSCDSCRDVVAALSSSVEPTPASVQPGSRIGRYVIVDELGRGAMATVYRARDPELDREVALKLVHFRDGGTSAERLLREARAMAKLTHPNVTRIYDVGTEGDAVFLAMELVAGMDLARWLRDSHTWREVVAVFAAAADGLAAAHRQLLIHRDFKPANVLVGDDGRVLVSDFGLVHTPSEADRELAAGQVADDVLLTRTGAIVGTPAYMAPELLATAAAADELSDQFSFAVALFEGLYGVRPFVGDDLQALRANVLAGRIRVLPADRDVPGWLHQLVLRGLGPRERRFASMAALAGALRADPRRRRRLIGAFAGVALVAATAVAGASKLAAKEAVDPCAAGDDKIAASWSPLKAIELRVGFAKSGVPFAADAYTATAARLDRFRTDWAAGYRAACQASRAGVQSGDLLDRRMQCLDSRRHELDALLGVLAAPDRSTIAHAPETADALSRVADCGNTVALGTLMPPPAGVDAGAIDKVKAGIARVHVLRNSPNPKHVIEEADQVLADAKKLGYAPVLAEANVASAIVHMVANQTKEANQAVEDAVVAAEAGRDFYTKAHALAVGMELAYNTGDFTGAVNRDRLARAALSAIGGNEKLEADLESVLGWIAARQEDESAAEKHLRRALELRIHALGAQDLTTARAYENLGTALGNRDLAAALGEYEKGLAIERAQLGGKHPAVAQTLGNVAIIQSSLGKQTEAIATAKEALAILEGSMPVNHPAVAFATLQLAGVYHQAHDYEHALSYQRKAVERYEAAVGPDHADLGRALTNLAATLAELERYDEMVPVARRALAIQEKAFGANSPGTATIRNNLATALAGVGKNDEALEQFQLALALREKAYGKDDPRLLSTLLGISAVHQARKAWREQIAILERAMTFEPKAKAPRDKSLIAKAAFELAMVQRAHGNKQRAKPLAERALAMYRELDRADDAAAVEKFLRG